MFFLPRDGTFWMLFTLSFFRALLFDYQQHAKKQNPVFSDRMGLCFSSYQQQGFFLWFVRIPCRAGAGLCRFKNFYTLVENNNQEQKRNLTPAFLTFFFFFWVFFFLFRKHTDPTKNE